MRGEVRVRIVVTYDVNTETAAGRKRLRQVAKCCVAHGQRVQNSVFECSLDEAQFVALRGQLESIIDLNKDSLRFYNLGKVKPGKIIHVGIKTGYNPDGNLIL
ncbi:CRISPR-associated endonuclease Cas2 [Acidaminococcus sp. AM05-11]|jgi:CRISPR-associated protein Cas2|nr:CRISPR-associated endonuclease Cas2 [Acidaminococcus hominis]RHK00985.1 CRISPR-associated endonuclease Cas2 [Acidaminococcus sp. AM05-11]